MTELPDAIEVRSDGLLIRRAKPEDLADLLSLLAQMHNEDPPSPPGENLLGVYREILSNPSRALLVAVAGESVVGTLDLLVVPNMSHGGQPWAAIENVVVDQAHRRQGIGGALVDVATDLARSHGCYKLQLVSHQRRDAAHALYRHARFDAPVAGYRRYLTDF